MSCMLKKEESPSMPGFRQVEFACNIHIVFPAYFVPAYLVQRIFRHLFESQPLFTYTNVKMDISSPGYLVILTSVQALTRFACKTVYICFSILSNRELLLK